MTSKLEYVLFFADCDHGSSTRDTVPYQATITDNLQKAFVVMRMKEHDRFEINSIGTKPTTSQTVRDTLKATKPWSTHACRVRALLTYAMSNICCRVLNNLAILPTPARGSLQQPSLLIWNINMKAVWMVEEAESLEDRHFLFLTSDFYF